MSEMTLGQKVRELRLSKQMTQKELAGDFITRNMLSQIENDGAMPSMKTMEYLAGRLGKPIGYFLDEQHEDVSLSAMITQLISLNEKKDYEASVALIEEQVAHNPMFMKNKMMVDLYTNSYMYLGNAYMAQGKYEQAKVCYEKLLRFEGDMMIVSDIYLYKIYAQLAEVNTYLSDIETAKVYHKKGKDLIGRLLAGREVQSLYMKLMEGDYDELKSMAKELDLTDYDPYSLARFNMVVGSAYFNEEDYQQAKSYLEKALAYYKEKAYNSITALLYEELSKCYSEMDDYKKAYDFLQKARESKL